MEPTLYIIMRSDLPDCNPGKGMAAAAHAQADFNAYINQLGWKQTEAEDADRIKALSNTLEDYRNWCNECNFGRTIVLSADKDTLNNISIYGNHSGKTLDPTYPWKNFYGELQITKEITCAWAFIGVSNENDSVLVENLPLHK